MANFGRQLTTASPVLAISPRPFFQTQLSAGTFGRHHPPPMSFSSASPALANPARSAGRKRSRDEASVNLEPDSRDPVTRDSREEWVYGEGMVLIKPGKGYVADASSQSGTWVEEKNNNEPDTRREIEATQTEIRNHKSQRLDHNPGRASLDGNSTSPVFQTSGHQGHNGNDTLVIDNFTVHLGIGWRKLSTEEHIQAAARGWAKFIEKSFGLLNVSICLESKGLQSYLVEAADGYYLFTENLRHGRLVSRTVEGALQNLQVSPPSFEGPELGLTAAGDRHSNVLPDSAMVID
ncbi:hypothetical protein VFPPC_01103 [Pochonia chlamydosporia 170]|uniref:Uncharacterized protein n=1 Tax=Pochonia chlamydosporia 170 TaxID=1380566 RepID=A0A179G7J8_METCM|nr:hypothetical protein VFPPC_01103 [Pochonia chlamydosporia 170]OAQ73383.2 hypothetical protein VFPPC_01103 [Pochonia chlamydosporia 170]